MAESLLGGVVEFLRNLGFYDVILPFLLVFSLMFAILDKTQVFGLEDGKPRKSINSVVAFVVALLVIGSTRLISVMNEAISNVAMLLIIITFIIVTISVFKTDGQYDLFQHAALKGWIIFVVTVIVILIFFQALGWNIILWDFLRIHISDAWVATLLFLVGIAVFIWLVTKGD